MKKALNMWTLTGFEYSGNLPMEEIVGMTKSLGYEGFEFCFDEKHLNPYSLTKSKRKQYVELFESHEVALTSVATTLFWKYDLGNPREVVRKKALKLVEKGLELARDLGAGVLLVVPAVASARIPYESMYLTSVSSLKKCVGWAEENGVKIGIENVWNKFLYSPLEFKRFIQEVGSEWVRAYLDIGNVLNIGLAEHWIETLGDMIVLVHVKDFDIKVGNLDGFRFLLKGDVNWKNVKRKLKGVGYNGFLVVECPPEFDLDLKYGTEKERGFKAAEENAKALTKILAI